MYINTKNTQAESYTTDTQTAKTTLANTTTSLAALYNESNDKKSSVLDSVQLSGEAIQLLKEKNPQLLSSFGIDDSITDNLQEDALKSYFKLNDTYIDNPPSVKETGYEAFMNAIKGLGTNSATSSSSLISVYNEITENNQSSNDSVFSSTLSKYGAINLLK